MTEKNVAEKSFRFSVVVAVYNAEEYLAETIDSLVNQTFSFEENVQVILVDDGSTDGSLAICEDYQKRYPHNIEVHAKENGGVSSARNLGIKYATGEFVNFLDSDDLWAPDAFEVMDSFLAAHPNVKLAAARIKHIGRWTSYHALDYKFEDGTRIVNIFADWKLPQLSASTTFIANEFVRDRQFVPIAIGEDFLYISSLVMELGVYGLVCEAEYWYRKKFESNSALDSSRSNFAYYTATLEQCHHALFAESKRLYGYVIPYVQYAVMYDIQWRMAAPEDGFLSEEALKSYRADILDLLSEISDEAIASQKNISARKKLYALAMKRGVSYDDLVRDLVLSDQCENPVYKQLFKRSITLEFIHVHDDRIVYEGYTESPIFPELGDVYIYNGRARYYAQPVERSELGESSFFCRNFAKKTGFVVEVPRDGSMLLEFRIGNKHNVGSGRASLSFGRFCKLTNAAPSSYFVDNGCAVVSRAKHQLRVMEKPSLLQLVKRELSFDKRIAAAEDGGYAVVLERLRGIVSKFVHRDTDVCLVSDRLGKADDNGEYFFQWLVAHAPHKIKPYFVLRKDSADYQRLSATGRVVDPDSPEYSRLFLRARYVVSSSFDNHVIHHFGKQEVFFKSLYDFDFIFLQHGVIKDDMSRTLGRFSKNIKTFVCSAESEWESVIELPYYYDGKEVLLSGLPRHDRLRDSQFDTEKRIIIAPTWRNSLVLGFDPETDKPIIPEATFLESEYYRAYSALLSDERLISSMRDNGYSADFVIHPGFAECADLFEGSELVRVRKEFDYNHEIESAAIMVTDFSSVCFDFALMGKPVVYFQFDEDAFFSGGHCFGKGYFDYREDGFGPVLNDVSSTVDYLVALMEGGARIEQKYAERAAKFFYYPPDGASSCSMVYEAMVGKGEEENNE